ncbi:hypothetical protein [Bacillus cereus]|uniref:Glucosamine inositolphosphorylceramide transferase 1 N-terminal domain-containing protein n=1 Tax=Bacillus cereus MC67 TaxID=1053219 RepID=J8EKR0_BACCE|nr:hypothetical protein [Bacillus cereus]EJQ97581.1 hypothetical protein II3_03975 [Bacillus cereus MC67]EOP17083.1 hypothetical protein II1_01795 [Bacillus cereus MC118]
MLNANRQHRLKIGIMLDSLVVSSWIEKIIYDIVHTEFLELSIVLINGNERVEKQNVFQQSVKKTSLYSKYLKWDYNYYSKYVRHNALKPVHMESLLSEYGCRILTIYPNKQGVQNEFSDSDLDVIRGGQLDVIIKLGFGTFHGEIINIARYGIWSYCFNGQGVEAFWEMASRKIPLETRLQILASKPENHKVIYRTISPLNVESLFFNRNLLYWKVKDIVLRRLFDLYKKGWSYITNLDTYNQPSLVNERPDKYPTNFQMIPFISRLAMHKLKSRLFMEHWFIAFKNRKEERSRFHIIKAPLSRFYADPFVIERNERNFIFFEDYIYSEGKGNIAFVEVDIESNSVSQPTTVLEKPYHLSYPFLIKDGGEIYMIPETSSNQTIELYKATNFPYEWEIEKVLMENVNAVDTTIIQHEGKYWLFTNVFTDGSSLDELYLFHSDSLFGQWVSHPMNPIVSDAKSARPAGNIFVHDGKLIRPSQNCLFSYGYSVNLNEIEILNEDSYREKKIKEITPSIFKRNKGTHTYVFNEDLEVLDGRKQVLKFK